MSKPPAAFVRNVLLLLLLAFAPTAGTAAAAEGYCQVSSGEYDGDPWTCAECHATGCGVQCDQYVCAYQGEFIGDLEADCYAISNEGSPYCAVQAD